MPHVQLFAPVVLLTERLLDYCADSAVICSQEATLPCSNAELQGQFRGNGSSMDVVDADCNRKCQAASMEKEPPA
jgi:hypothetical protein